MFIIFAFICLNQYFRVEETVRHLPAKNDINSNSNKNIDQICVSDSKEKCSQIQGDFIFITSLDEISCNK